MRKILRICMLALLITVTVFPCNKAFASSDTFIKTASGPKYSKNAKNAEKEKQSLSLKRTALLF